MLASSTSKKSQRITTFFLRLANCPARAHPTPPRPRGQFDEVALQLRKNNATSPRTRSGTAVHDGGLVWAKAKLSERGSERGQDRVGLWEEERRGRSLLLIAVVKEKSGASLLTYCSLCFCCELPQIDLTSLTLKLRRWRRVSGPIQVRSPIAGCNFHP